MGEGQREGVIRDTGQRMHTRVGREELASCEFFSCPARGVADWNPGSVTPLECVDGRSVFAICLHFFKVISVPGAVSRLVAQGVMRLSKN